MTQQKELLKVELAIIIDYSCQFVTTTYNLEGDGPLAFVCYESVSALTAAVNIANYPNLNAVCKEISSGNQVTEQNLVVYGKSMCRSCHSLLQTETGQLHESAIQSCPSVRATQGA